MTEAPHDSRHPTDGADDKEAPHLVAKPALCLSCAKDGNPKEEILCNLNRLDHEGQPQFYCFAYVPKEGS